MIALDTDVFTLVLAGHADSVQKLRFHLDQHHVIPVVVAEEVFRGRLNAIKRANTPDQIAQVYELFRRTVATFASLEILPFDKAAVEIGVGLRKTKLRVGTSDLRIAASCIAHNATLVTRNARDFSQIPGLTLEIW